MDQKDEQQLRETFHNGITEAHRNGLLQGSKAMCKVILDMVNDAKKTPEEKIDDVRRFCEVSLTNKK